MPLVLKRASGNGLRLFLTHNLTHEGKFGGGDETVGEDEGFLSLPAKTGGKVYNDFKMPETRLYLVSGPIGKDEVPGSNPGNSSKSPRFLRKTRAFTILLWFSNDLTYNFFCEFSHIVT